MAGLSRKKFISDMKHVLNVSANFLLRCFLSIKNSTRYYSAQTSSRKVTAILLDFKKIKFSRQILAIIHNTTFHVNAPSGSRNVSCGRTDVRTDIKKLTVAFHNFTKAYL